MDSINLGKKWEGDCCGSASPSGKTNISFPSVYLDSVKGLELPDSGTITFRYEVCNESRSPKNETRGYSLDLLQIVDVKQDETSKKIAKAKDVLDSLAAEEAGETKPDDESDDSDRSQYAAQ